MASHQTHGFSLVEFMVAITVSLIVLAAMTSTFVANSRARTELERANQQIENGRYAISVLADDLNLAGYLGTFNLTSALGLPPPIDGTNSKPRPCETLLEDDDDAPVLPQTIDLATGLPMHVQGYDNVADTDGDGIANVELIDEDADGTPDLDCLAAAEITDVRPDTDILVIRRVSTASCDPSAAGCPELADAPYFQASRCATELGQHEATTWPPLAYRFDTPDGAATGLPTPFTLRQRGTGNNCSGAGPTEVRRYLVHIYVVTNNDQPGDGIPTLKRVELRRAEVDEAVVDDADEFDAFPLANGIENLQVEYGLDCGNPGGCALAAYDGQNRDGAPDFITANPDTFNLADPTAPFANCSANNVPNAGCLANWLDVMSVKISLLARNPEPSSGYTDTKVYTLGLNADGNAQCATDSDGDPTTGCEAFNDGFRRHVYQSVVRLVNPATRRDQ